MRFTAVPVCLPPVECSPYSSEAGGSRLHSLAGIQPPITSLPCHPVHISKLFQAGGERELYRYSPRHTITPAHTPDCSQDIFIAPLLPHDQGSSLAQLGSFSCHCSLLSCSVPQPLSCILSPSSISWALATTSGLLTQTHSHFLPCLENAPPIQISVH